MFLLLSLNVELLTRLISEKEEKMCYLCFCIHVVGLWQGLGMTETSDMFWHPDLPQPHLTWDSSCNQAPEEYFEEFEILLEVVYAD